MSNETKYELRISGGFVREWDVSEVSEAAAELTLTKLDNPDELVELIKIESHVALSSGE